MNPGSLENIYVTSGISCVLDTHFFVIRSSESFRRSFLDRVPKDEKLYFPSLFIDQVKVHQVLTRIHSESEDIDAKWYRLRAAFPAGDVRWTEWFFDPVYDAEGALLEVRCNGKAVTDLQNVPVRPDSTLLDLQFRAMADVTSDGLCVCEPSGRGRILAANETLGRLLGNSVAKICELSYCDIDPVFRKFSELEFAQWCEQVQSSGRDRSYDCEYRNALGRLIFVEVTITWRVIDGQNLMLATLRDVTEIRFLERELLAVSEAERGHLSRDLHDTVSQEITASLYLADTMLTRQKDPVAADMLKKVDRIAESLVRAQNYTRLILDSRNRIDIAGRDALELVCDFLQRVQEMYGIECFVKSEVESSIVASSFDANLYCIIRESVFNAVRHAQASQIVVSLLPGDGKSIELSIHDDGRGFVPKVERAHGYGLRNIKSRVLQAGGSVRFKRSPDLGGLCVSATIPAKTSEYTHV